MNKLIGVNPFEKNYIYLDFFEVVSRQKYDQNNMNEPFFPINNSKPKETVVNTFAFLFELHKLKHYIPLLEQYVKTFETKQKQAEVENNKKMYQNLVDKFNLFIKILNDDADAIKGFVVQRNDFSIIKLILTQIEDRRKK
jgi:hypothetical protein